jgi:O-acetylhomoserine/O-acetylserine sulfhydrylase-like pyridoxal-dependent enzyme
MALRMTARSLNALKLVEYLEAHSKVLKVNYRTISIMNRLSRSKKILVACYPLKSKVGVKPCGSLITAQN